MWAIEDACARVISLSRSIPVSCEGKRATPGFDRLVSDFRYG